MKSMKVARMVLVGVVTGATALMMTVTGVQAATYTWTPLANGGDGATWGTTHANWSPADATLNWGRYGNAGNHVAALGANNVTLGAEVGMSSFTGDASSSITASADGFSDERGGWWGIAHERYGDPVAGENKFHLHGVTRELH